MHIMRQWKEKQTSKEKRGGNMDTKEFVLRVEVSEEGEVSIQMEQNGLNFLESVGFLELAKKQLLDDNGTIKMSEEDMVRMDERSPH